MSGEDSASLGVESKTTSSGERLGRRDDLVDARIKELRLNDVSSHAILDLVGNADASVSGMLQSMSTNLSLTGPVRTVGVVSTPAKSSFSFSFLGPSASSVAPGGGAFSLSSEIESPILPCASLSLALRSLTWDVVYARFWCQRDHFERAGSQPALVGGRTHR